MSSAPPLGKIKRRTIAQLLRRLGDIPAERVWLVPTPGTATEQDVLWVHDHLGRLCELVDGVLVEKAMGLRKSVLALQLGHYLCNYMDQHPLGIVAGSDGMIKITTGLIRIPDVTFISWDHLPGRAIPAEPIPKVPIDLAVEVLSKSNTRREMKRKLGDYVASGARLVWYIDPRKRTARVYAADDEGTEIGEDDSLEGGEVLPGFSLPLRTLLDSARGAPQA